MVDFIYAIIESHTARPKQGETYETLTTQNFDRLLESGFRAQTFETFEGIYNIKRFSRWYNVVYVGMRYSLCYFSLVCTMCLMSLGTYMETPYHHEA